MQRRPRAGSSLFTPGAATAALEKIVAALRRRRVTVLRQQPLGGEWVDLLVPGGRLAIELSCHKDPPARRMRSPRLRDETARTCGYEVLRITTVQVLVADSPAWCALIARATGARRAAPWADPRRVILRRRDRPSPPAIDARNWFSEREGSD